MLGNLMAKVQLPEDDDKKEKDRASRIFGSSSPTHFIQADTRRNAIIVYDRLKKMELYAYLIAEMDQPTDQIQIEVSIFDIEERKLKDIGINWQYSNDSAQQTFGFGDVVGNLADEDTSINLGESNELSYFLGNGSTVSTVLEEGGEYFITRVRALADKGYAKVLSQPSILTQDNLEAVLDNSRTFFIRLEGQEAVSLQRVTVGSLLKVTPQIVDDFIGTRQVQLNLNIEDGVITNETVDDLPIINETKISTNAQIDEGSSLLIGGYFFNVRNESEVKTPFLGSIPLLGHLFKRTVTENSKTARLFMLTPKIVSTSINLESSEFEKSMLNQYYEETEEKFDFFKAIEILD
jgi:type III secretion protein C